MTCAACASERESRLRAEREREDLAEGFRLRGINNDLLRKHLATAERERDEARLILAATVSAADQDRARAQKRIEGLEDSISELHGLAETAIEDFPCEGGNGCSNVRHIEAFLGAAREARKKLATAALSFPAVTTGGLGKGKVE